MGGVLGEHAPQIREIIEGEELAGSFSIFPSFPLPVSVRFCSFHCSLPWGLHLPAGCALTALGFKQDSGLSLDRIRLLLSTQQREELEEGEAAQSLQELDSDQELEPGLESKLLLLKQQQLKKLKRCWLSWDCSPPSFLSCTSQLHPSGLSYFSNSWNILQSPGLGDTELVSR